MNELCMIYPGMRTCTATSSVMKNVNPGEKDRVNARLARALVGTTRLYADVCE